MCIIHDLFLLIRSILFNGLPRECIYCDLTLSKHGCCYFAAIFALTSGLRTHLQISREIVLFWARKKTNRNKNRIWFFSFIRFHNELIEMNFGLSRDFFFKIWMMIVVLAKSTQFINSFFPIKKAPQKLKIEYLLDKRILFSN